MSVMNASDEYEAVIEKGRRLCNDLKFFVLLDSLIRRQRMKALYQVDSEPLRRNIENEIPGALTTCETSISNLNYVEVRSFKLKIDDVVYCNHLNGGNDVLVCSENIKSRDENAPDEKL